MGYAIFPGPDWVQVPAGHGSLRYLRKEHSVNQFCERKSCSRVDFNVPFSLKSKDHAGIGCWKQRESKLMALWNYSGERCFLDLVLNCTWVQWSGYRPKPQQSQSSLIRLVSAGAPSGTQPKFAQSLLRKEDCHPPDQSSAAAGLWVHSPPRASPTDQEPKLVSLNLQGHGLQRGWKGHETSSDHNIRFKIANCLFRSPSWFQKSAGRRRSH